ncbi:MAG: DUF424 family protein [Candidatus Micrarchaeota archaeon]
MIYFKLHKQGEDVILAVADKDALGKKYEGGGMVLDLQAFRSFYEGELAKEEEIAELLKQCTCANLAGKKAVSVAIDNGFAKSENVVVIGGIPHMQLFRIEDKKQ